MKQVLIFSTSLLCAILTNAQSSRRIATTAPLNNTVARQATTVPIVDKAKSIATIPRASGSAVIGGNPGSTARPAPGPANDNSNRTLGMNKVGSWYSGIYTSNYKVGGIPVTKTFRLHQSVTEKYQDGSSGARSIEPTTMGKINVPRKNAQGTKNDEKWPCTSEDRRITLDDQGYLTLDVASQITKVYPGKAFHYDDYNNGSWNDIQEKRKPFRISCSNPNINGNVVEQVNDAREGTIRQAVANIYNRFPTDPAKVANLSFAMYAQEVHNTADLSVRIGAGGYGFGFSANNMFSFSEKSSQKTFFVDITKVLYTIDAEHPAGGLFSDPSINTNDIMYMASVSYGMRILASIELNITDETVLNSFNSKYEGLLYGGNINAEVFARDVKNQATVKFFVVGGTSNTVTPAYNISDMQKQIVEMTRNINYHTCHPIRYSFKNNEGELVSYKSATDWFKERSCEPPGENMQPATVKVRISSISLKNPGEDDVDLYGGIWANVYKSGNRFKVPADNQYDLLKLPPELHLKHELIKNGEYAMGYGRAVTFDFAAEEAAGAVLYVYFNLTDEDDSPDDPIVMPNLRKFAVKNNNQTHEFYGLKINLDDIKKGENDWTKKNFNVDCVDYEGDYPFTIAIEVIKK